MRLFLASTFSFYSLSCFADLTVRELRCVLDTTAVDGPKTEFVLYLNAQSKLYDATETVTILRDLGGQVQPKVRIILNDLQCNFLSNRPVAKCRRTVLSQAQGVNEIVFALNIEQLQKVSVGAKNEDEVKKQVSPVAYTVEANSAQVLTASNGMKTLGNPTSIYDRTFNISSSKGFVSDCVSSYIRR